MLALDRLVGIGVRADGDGAGRIARRAQLPLQQRCRARFHEQLRFEIEPGRKAHIGVRGAREAVDAAVLAAPIGIDRAVEGDIGRIVARDDGLRLFQRHLRLERRQFGRTAPAVILGHPRLGLVAAAAIRDGAPATPAVPIHEFRRGWLSLQARVRPAKNVPGRRARTTLGRERPLSVADLEVDRTVRRPRQGRGGVRGGVRLWLRFQHGIALPALNITRTKHRSDRSASASFSARFQWQRRSC